MNHTTVTLAILVAILVTFVVGISVITTSATQSAYAYNKIGHNGDIVGNTITNQKCAENGIVIGSGNPFQQECRPLICTNSSGNAICSQEGTGSDVTGRLPGNYEACFDSFTAALKTFFPAASPAPG